MNFFVGRIFFAIVLVLYPVLIFCALRFGEFSPRKLALLLLLLVALRIFLFAQHKHPSIPVKEIGFTTILLLCGILTFSLDNAKFLLFYLGQYCMYLSECQQKEHQLPNDVHKLQLKQKYMAL